MISKSISKTPVYGTIKSVAKTTLFETIPLVMVNKEKARELAMAKILDLKPVGFEPVIVDDATIEKDFGWVFFWNSREYLETQDYRHRLAGNCPIIVNKFDGSTELTGSARDTEYYISEYEKNLKPRD